MLTQGADTRRKSLGTSATHPLFITLFNLLACPLSSRSEPGISVALRLCLIHAAASTCLNTSKLLPTTMHSHALLTLHCTCIDVRTIWSLNYAKLSDAAYEFSGTFHCITENKLVMEQVMLMLIACIHCCLSVGPGYCIL